MKQFLLIILCATFATLGNAQSTEKDFVNHFKGKTDLVPTNLASPEARTIGNANLSQLWTCHDHLGYIGDNYQRLRMNIHSVWKLTPERYKLKGTSRVKDNDCDFEGTLTIKHVFAYDNEEAHFGERCYALLATYELKENRAQQGSGVFSGLLTTYFYIQDGYVHLGDLMEVADGYENNQYEGTWTSYKTKKAKKANWGICRIPDSGDLDQGVGEFIPSEKYHAYGWASYRQELEEGNKTVSYIEGEGTLDNGMKWRKMVWKDGKAEVILLENDQLTRIFRPVIHDEMVPNDNATVGEVTLEDINFDGYKDIVISLGAFGTSYNEYYDGYVFNPKTRKYDVTSYQMICNPKPDAKAKTVNACYHISNDKEGYEVWQFKDGDFVKVSERVEELRD